MVSWINREKLFSGGIDFSQIDEKEQEQEIDIIVSSECKKYDIPNRLEQQKFTENEKFVKDCMNGTRKCQVFLQGK